MKSEKSIAADGRQGVKQAGGNRGIIEGTIWKQLLLRFRLI